MGLIIVFVFSKFEFVNAVRCFGCFNNFMIKGKFVTK